MPIWWTSANPWEGHPLVRCQFLFSGKWKKFTFCIIFVDCTKYFGCELGAQTQFDHKNERYIVNGAHDAAKLQDMLDGFIRKFVLCEMCDNPETVLKALVKKGIINATCKACGHSFMLDMRHKLTTYILRV